MPDLLRPRSFTSALLATVIFSVGIGGCQPSGTAIQTTSPSPIVAPSPRPTAPVVDGGLITLTDDGCTWAVNPGSIQEGRLKIAVRNETDDYGLFIIHKLRPGRTFDDGVAAVALIQEALLTQTDWPEDVFEVSDAVADATADAGLEGNVTLTATAGTFGVVCSANTSATGDVLTTFLVGPLEVTRP